MSEIAPTCPALEYGQLAICRTCKWTGGGPSDMCIRKWEEWKMTVDTVYIDSWGCKAVSCRSDLYKSIRAGRSYYGLMREAVRIGIDSADLVGATDEQLVYLIGMKMGKIQEGQTMAKTTGISWCDSTFNPWIGCTKVSPGCKYCYAESFMTRKTRWADTWGPTGERLRTSESYWRKPYQWDTEIWSECQNKCGWRGDILYLWPDGADGYYHCPKCNGMTKPTRLRVFCASLADVFEDNPQVVGWREDLFEMIAATKHLDWLLLTKRPENVNRMIADMYGDCCWLEDYGQNIWIGTSVENQEQADKRIPALLDIPARIRFLSVEPLLEPVELLSWLHGIHWVIIGGESGPKARPFNMTWAYSIIEQCMTAHVPVFMKQVGCNPFYGEDKVSWLKDFKGSDPDEWPEALVIQMFPETTNAHSKIDGAHANVLQC